MLVLFYRMYQYYFIECINTIKVETIYCRQYYKKEVIFVYESITYAELKSLPREQKIEALKELKALYSSQKKIAEKLGVNPPNIYNMISRYIKNDTEKKPRSKRNRIKDDTAGTDQFRVEAIGNKSVKDEPNKDKVIKKEAIEDEMIKKEAIEAEVINNKAIEDEMIKNEAIEDEVIKNEVIEAEDNISYVIDSYRRKTVNGQKQYRQSGFLISIVKEMTGEEAQSMLAGIGNIFLKNREYRLDIRITEK